jgi:AcrR family transcriptional regulator
VPPGVKPEPAAPADATRERLVQAARELVVERGYDGVSTAEVLERAGVSRGGLYHHFAGKAELMAAVLVAVELDFVARLQAVVADIADPFAALQVGTQWYLDECARSEELQRTGLHEGRRALGWDAWRESMAPHGLALLAANLEAAIAAGQVRATDAQTLAHLLVALLHEAVTLIVAAEDRAAERARVGSAVAAVIDGLRT